MITKHIASVERALHAVSPGYRSEWELFDDDPRTAHADVTLAEGAGRLDATLTYDRTFGFRLQSLLDTGAITVATPALSVYDEDSTAEGLRQALKVAEQLRADVYEPLAADPVLADLVPEPRELAVDASTSSVTGGHALLTAADGTGLVMDVAKGSGGHWYITSVEPCSDTTPRHLIERAAEAICALPAGEYLPVSATAQRLSAALDDSSATAHLSQMTPVGGSAVIDFAGTDAAVYVRSPLGADHPHLEVSFTGSDGSDGVLLYRAEDLSLPSAQVMNELVPAIERALEFTTVRIASVESLPPQVHLPSDDEAEDVVGRITLSDETCLEVRLGSHDGHDTVWLYRDGVSAAGMFITGALSHSAIVRIPRRSAALAAGVVLAIERLECRGKIS